MAIQGGRGKIEIFEDFTGIAAAVTLTDATAGNRHNDLTLVAISGNATQDWVVTESGGVSTFVGAGAAADGVAVLASPMQPSVNGTMLIEARWKSSVVTDCRLFVGFQQTASLSETVNPFTLSGTTLTANAAGEVVGFYFDAQATTDDFRFMSGSNSAASTTAALDYALGGQTTMGSLGVRANATVTAAKWSILRVEIDTDGTARGYCGDETMGNTTGLTHIATLRAGDLSTTTLYHPHVHMAQHSTGAGVHSLDYVRISGNRNWAA